MPSDALSEGVCAPLRHPQIGHLGGCEALTTLYPLYTLYTTVHAVPP